MKLLLTSAGITNASILQALEDLLAKPVPDAAALYVPTATYALADGPGFTWKQLQSFADMGWRDFGVLELTALPSTLEEFWLPALEAADVLIVGGGNTAYLSYWLHRSGLAERLPDLLRNTVYLGVSAGSMMATHGINVNRDKIDETGIYYDDEYDEAAPPNAGCDRTLKLVDFVIRPHLNSPYFPTATLALMERAAAKVDVPLYAIDDQTAIKVTGSDVVVVSEGEWKLF